MASSLNHIEGVNSLFQYWQSTSVCRTWLDLRLYGWKNLNILLLLHRILRLVAEVYITQRVTETYKIIAAVNSTKEKYMIHCDQQNRKIRILGILQKAFLKTRHLNWIQRDKYDLIKVSVRVQWGNRNYIAIWIEKVLRTVNYYRGLE